MSTILDRFRGRASRARFWTILAIVSPSFVALMMIFWAYAISVPGAYENGGPTPLPKGPLGLLAAVAWFAGMAALLAALLSVAIRRLHDRDKGWWWIFVFLIVPDALFGYGRYLLDTQMGAAGELPLLFVYGASTLYVWGLIELGFLRGTLGENRFGPDPVG